jgi:uncharacterized membrane protein YgcG
MGYAMERVRIPRGVVNTIPPGPSTSSLRKWAFVVAALLLAVSAYADDYPHPTAFVNDFANQLPVAAVQALETKVHAYERATGNEIAVAVVPSLNGMLIDDYARGLFHAWGVGKAGVNNGVLFVWAPHERRIRIEVGTGLQGVLTDTGAGLILQNVRGLFGGKHYDAGVNAAVDGIIAALGMAPTAAAAPEGRNFVQRNSPEGLERQRQAAAQRQREEIQQRQDESAARAAADRRRQIGLGVAALFAIGLYLIYRRRRASHWQAELPDELAEADRALAEADRKRAQAQIALLDLRKEATPEIYQRFDAVLGSAPDQLRQRKSDLADLRLLPRVEYGDLRTVRARLHRWHVSMATMVSAFDEVPAMLETFRAGRAEAQRLLESLPSALARMRAQGLPGSREGLLLAAAETYNQALKESQAQPANWLLVCDLLTDVSACLQEIENPEMRTEYRPVRYWYGDIASPAAVALAALAATYASQAAASPVSILGGGSSGDDSGWFGGGGDSGGSGGGDSGGSGGGGDAGGFGGGDSGGGGASSDY